MGFGSRKPTSNEPGRINEGNQYGPQDTIRDDFSVLLNGEGKRCSLCKRVILNKYLKYKYSKPYCPECLPDT
jgi:hypothetical protein